ncbi:MAG: leucine-rich repeat domain-containing protein [Clostridia bacterium]|nr:leucine-rich repeat domain-containing protein [Clostridia bacterium]
MENNKNFIIENGILKKYIGKEEHVLIPEGVREIGEEAFAYRKEIKTVSFPKSLQKIGAYAFHCCYGLECVLLGEEISVLHCGAFSFCYGMKFLRIQGKHVKISEAAFDGCVQLERCEIACEFETARKEAYFLRKCFAFYRLAYVFLKGEWKSPKSLSDRLAHLITLKNNRREIFRILLIDAQASLLDRYLSMLKNILPEELDALIGSTNDAECKLLLMEYKNKKFSPEYLWKREQIQTEKDFGLREKTISDYRKDFTIIKGFDCYIITSYKEKKNEPDEKEEQIVFIPGRIKGLPVKIADFAFSHSRMSGNVMIEEGCTEIGDYAFSGTKELKSIYIPNGTKIGMLAFFDCTRLTSVQIGEHATVGKAVFGRCASLRECILPEETLYVGNPFFGCYKLADANGFVIINGILFDYLGHKSEITVPEHVKEIAPHALSSPVYLKKIKIPMQTKISEKAFTSQSGTEISAVWERYL